MSRDPGCIAGPCMYRDRYFEIERLLDEALGSEDTDGAGEGIVADIRLALAAAEKRGAEKATAETIMGGQRYAVVWALRRAAEDWRRNGLTWDDPDEETNTDLRVARSLDQRADRIQAGSDR